MPPSDDVFPIDDRSIARLDWPLAGIQFAVSELAPRCDQCGRPQAFILPMSIPPRIFCPTCFQLFGPGQAD